MRIFAIFLVTFWLAVPLQAIADIESLLSDGELTVNASLDQRGLLVPGTAHTANFRNCYQQLVFRRHPDTYSRSTGIGDSADGTVRS